MNTTTPAPASASSLQLKCEAELKRLLDKHPSILFISLASVDGRSYVHVHGQQKSDGPRIAAITSSFLGLSESFAREACQSTCRYSMIAMEAGSVVTVRIPTKSLRFALAIGATDLENLGTILRAALDGASVLARLLEPPSLSPST